MLTRHWLSLLGVALLATAVISWLFVLPQQIRGHFENPYVGIVVNLLAMTKLQSGSSITEAYCTSRRHMHCSNPEGFAGRRGIEGVRSVSDARRRI